MGKKIKMRKNTKGIDEISLEPVEYDNLAIEGGGVLGIAYIGVIRELYRDGSIHKCKNFIGSSIGSLLALLLAIRTPINQIDSVIQGIDLREFKDRSFIFADLSRLLFNYGFYKGDNFLAFIRKILESTDNPDLTFSDLYKRYGTNLIITGTNISTGTLVYFNKEDYPTMSVALAVRISGSVPYFFKSIRYNGDYYVDGGVLNNYPINYFGKDTSTTTLGLKLISDTDLMFENGKMPAIHNIKNFSSNLINCVMNQALKIHVAEDDWKRTVKIFTGSLSYIDFDLTPEQKEHLISEGAKAIIAYKTWKFHQPCGFQTELCLESRAELTKSQQLSEKVDLE